MTRPSYSAPKAQSSDVQNSSAQSRSSDQQQLVTEQKRIATKDLFNLIQSGASKESLIISGVRIVLSEGANVNAVDSKYQTPPLHIACQNGYKEVAEILLANGAQVNQVSNNGATPLHIACQNGHKEVVQLLLDKGAKVDQVKNDGWTPLHLACLYCYTEVVNILLEKKAEVNRGGKDGWTPLHIACRNGRKEVVQLLLDKGAKVDQVKNDGWTPLHLACINGYTEVAEILLANGAEVNRGNNGGWTPLHLACNNGHAQIAKTLLLSGANTSIPQRGSDAQKQQIKETILNALRIITPAEIKAIEDQAEQNPEKLKKIRENDVRLAVKLLEKNPDALSQDLFGAIKAEKERLSKLLISAASLSNNIEEVKKLIDDGADVNWPIHDYGRTPFHYACENGKTEVVKILLENGASINRADTSGRTPFHSACERGQTEVVKILLENGADINQADNYGNTPLHFACERGRAEVVKILLDRVENINQANNDGWTPIYGACAYGHEEIIKTFLLSGKKISIPQRDERKNNKVKMDILSSLESITHEEILAIEADQQKFNKIQENGVYLAIKMLNNEIKSENLSEEQKTNFKDLIDIVEAGQELNNSLILSSKKGDVKQVQKLIDRGADVNYSVEGCGDVPLYFACQEKHKDLVKVLLENGATFDSDDEENLVYDFSDPEINKILLLSGLMVPRQTMVSYTYEEAQNEEAQTEILKCIESIREEIPTINQNPEQLDKIKKNGVYVAIQLLEGKDRRTLSEKEILQVDRLFDLIYDQITTPEQRKMDKEICELVRKRGLTEEQIIEQIEQLIENGANINSREDPNEGCGPLHYAYRDYHTKIAKFLLDKGAYVNMIGRGCYKITPFNIACISNNKEIIIALLEKGANVNKIEDCTYLFDDEHEYVPILGVCGNPSLGENDKLEIIKTLLLSGANVSIPQVGSNDQKEQIKETILNALKIITPEEISAIKDKAKQNPQKLKKITETGVYLATKILHQAKEEEERESIGEIEKQELDDLLIKAISYNNRAQGKAITAQEKRFKIITSRIASELVDSQNFSSQQKIKLIDAMISEQSEDRKEFNSLFTTLNLTKTEPLESGEVKFKTFDSVFNKVQDVNTTTITNDQSAKKVSTADIAPIILCNLVTKKVALDPKQKVELLSIFTHPITKHQATANSRDEEVMTDALATSPIHSTFISEPNTEMTDSQSSSAQQNNPKKRSNDSGVLPEEAGDQKRLKVGDEVEEVDENQTSQASRQSPAQSPRRSPAQTQASPVDGGRSQSPKPSSPN